MKNPEGPSREFYRILGVCFNAAHTVFLEISGYIHTDIQTNIQKVSFYNIEAIEGFKTKDQINRFK